MKKKICLIGLLLLIATITLPITTKAKDLDLTIYTAETLQETLTKENITGDFTNYQATDDKATIYVFRQDGCLNCKNFYNFVANTLLVNHADKFRVISYEVKNNQLNNNLRIQVQDFMGEEVNVTPYIIIGEKTFSGHIDAAKQKEIEAAILALYNDANKYDVLKDMKDNKKEFSDATNKIIVTTSKALNKNNSLKTINTNHQDLTIANFNYITSYDIKIVDDKNNIVPSNTGTFTIKIPVTQKFDMYKVVSLDTNGTTTDINNVSYKDGYIIFTTTNLLEYVVYGKNNTSNDTTNETVTEISNQINEENPNTLDNIQLYVLILILGSITLVSSSIILKKKIN